MLSHRILCAADRTGLCRSKADLNPGILTPSPLFRGWGPQARGPAPRSPLGTRGTEAGCGYRAAQTEAILR